MMADFTRIKDQDVWINLDYVVRIERGDDEEGTATVTFADGSTFTISDADRKRLVNRLRPPKAETPAWVTLPDGSSFTVSNAAAQKLLKGTQAAKKKKKKKKKKETPPAPVASDAEAQPTPDEAAA